MGFWKNVFSGVVKAATWVANEVIKPAARVVQHALDWVERKVDNVYGHVKNVVGTARAFVGSLEEAIGGQNSSTYRSPYNTRQQTYSGQGVYEQIEMERAFLADTSRHVDALRAQMMANFQQEAMLAQARQQQELAILQRKHEERMQEIARKQQQMEMLMELLGSINALLKRTKQIASEERMQQFDNFSRLRVSVVFLQDLVVNLKTVEDMEKLTLKQREFLALIEQFIEGTISDDKILKLDSMTREIYNKDLLEFGTEALVTDYIAEFNFRKERHEEATEALSNLEIDLESLKIKIELTTLDETGRAEVQRSLDAKQLELESQKVKVEQLKAEMQLSEEFLLSIKAMMHLAKNYERYSEADLSRAEEIGTIFLKRRENKELELSADEHDKIVRFNSMALYKEWTEYNVPEQFRDNTNEQNQITV